MLDGAGASALLVDDYAEMEIVSQKGARVSDRYPYFSLFNLDGSARAVTVTGAKYPLHDAALPCDSSLGVSNEPLPGQTASVRVDEGRLLLIRIREE